MNTLDRALELAAIGFRVFPIPANQKNATLVDWPTKATTDPAKIRAWFTDFDGDPIDHNIAICTNDLLVLDIDAKGGTDPLTALSELEAELGHLPHVVETPSGGYHAYMRLPEGALVGNSAKTVKPWLDTRSHHGYVLAPGSSIEGRPYEWVTSAPDDNAPPTSIADLPIAPQTLIDKIGAPKPKADLPSNINYDSPESVALAVDFLKRAKPAIQGEGGDAHTFATAARLRDFAVSEDTALELLLDHWNNRCEPPWDPEALQAKVNNAYRYAENTPREPGSEFGAVDIGNTEATSALVFSPHGPLDLASLPKREWLIEGVAAKGFVTLISAPPGSGKTQLIAQLMLAATYSLDTGFPVIEPVKTWVFNAEDDIAEMRRRIGAAMLRHDLTWQSRKHDWAIASGVDHSLTVAKWDSSTHRISINHKAIANIKQQIQQNGIGLLILDPFADIHEAPESDNDAIKKVMAIFTTLAKETNIAIIIATHTRKLQGASSEGHAGNAESVRGASAMVAKARVVLTLMPMNTKEAKAHKIDPAHTGSYMRVDTAKNNLGPTERGAKPLWFKWENTPLPNGDKVGVLVPAALEKTESRVKREAPDDGSPRQEDILAEILAKTPGAMDGVLWRKDVLPAFMAATQMGETAARKWFIALPERVKTPSGTICKASKLGAAGARVALDLFDEETNDLDEEGGREA